jgi:hypothetical protein
MLGDLQTKFFGMTRDAGGFVGVGLMLKTIVDLG